MYNLERACAAAPMIEGSGRKIVVVMDFRGCAYPRSATARRAIFHLCHAVPSLVPSRCPRRLNLQCATDEDRTRHA